MWPIRSSVGGGGGGSGSAAETMYCSDELDKLAGQVSLEWADDDALSPPLPAQSGTTTTVHRRFATSQHVSSISFPATTSKQHGRAPSEQHNGRRPSLRRPPLSASASNTLRPYRSDAAATSALASTARAPIRLDKRRLDKAVSLAIEAAQASEQDERAWRRYDRIQQRRTQSNASLCAPPPSSASSSSAATVQTEGRMGRLGRLRSLGGGWKRASLDLGRLQRQYYSGSVTPAGGTDTSDDGGEGGAPRAVVPYRPRVSGGGESSSASPAERAGTDSTTLDGGEASSSADEFDDEEPPSSDDFSIDLYISSLGYLLAALKPEDASTVRDAQRKELIGKLRDALDHLEAGQGDEYEQRRGVRSDEDILIIHLQQKLAMLEQVTHTSNNGVRHAYIDAYGRPGIAATATANSAVESRAPSDKGRRSLTGYLASTALDFGLTVGAGVVAAAARGVAGVLPSISKQSGPDDAVQSMTPSSPSPPPTLPLQQTQQTLSRRPGQVRPQATRSSTSSSSEHTLMSGPQWDLTRSLVGTLSSTLYNQLAAVAEQQRSPPTTTMTVANPGAAAPSAVAVQDHPEARATDADAADRLVMLSASLARSVKRSPLPTQVRSLAWQVASLASALDKRYSLSRRTVDVALRKAGQALTFVRRNDLHVKAVRVAWALVEASVVAIEAYREEEGWSPDGVAMEDDRLMLLDDGQAS